MFTKPDIPIERMHDMVLGGGTDADIASIYQMSIEELRQHYGEFIDSTRAARRISLHSKQTKVAVAGNVPMLIFLGKHELGQNDHSDNEMASHPEPRLDYKMG